MSKPSSTSIQRRAHQLSPKLPRFDWALMPPLAWRGRDRGKDHLREYHTALFSQRLLAQCEQVLQIGGGQLGEPALAGADDPLGDLFLVLDHVVDPFLERAGAEEL